MKILFALMMLAAAQQPAGNSHPEDVNDRILARTNAQWRACKADSDCGITPGFCKTPVAANKHFSKDVSKFLAAKSGGCLNPLDRSVPTGTKCISNKCELAF